jgi:hypothetical protein
VYSKVSGAFTSASEIISNPASKIEFKPNIQIPTLQEMLVGKQEVRPPGMRVNPTWMLLEEMKKYCAEKGHPSYEHSHNLAEAVEISDRTGRRAKATNTWEYVTSDGKRQ